MRIELYLTFDHSDKDIKNLINKLGIQGNGSYEIYSFNIYHDDEKYMKLEPYIKSGKIMCLPANAKYEYTISEMDGTPFISVFLEY